MGCHCTAGATKRQVVMVRQGLRGGVARERCVNGQQLRLDLAGPSVLEGERLWEYAVMVTDVKYPLHSIGQRYRERADCVDWGFCQNGFDEWKTQWPTMPGRARCTSAHCMARPTFSSH